MRAGAPGLARLRWIAVKRADADAEFVGERRAAHRPAAATQRLDKIDAAVRSATRSLTLLSRQDSARHAASKPAYAAVVAKQMAPWQKREAFPEKPSVETFARQTPGKPPAPPARLADVRPREERKAEPQAEDRHEPPVRTAHSFAAATAPLPAERLPLILEVAPNDDYALIDSGDGEKLEQYGPYRIVRPEGQAIWQKALPPRDWEKADAVFTGDTDEEGMGRWRFPKDAARRDLADAA